MKPTIKILSRSLVIMTVVLTFCGCALGRVHINVEPYKFSPGVWNWVNKNPAFSVRQNPQAVAFHGSVWMIGGRSDFSRLNDVWSSADGSNWIQATSAASFAVRDEFASDTDGGKIWIAGGLSSSGPYRNDVWYSTNGTNWSQATTNIGFTSMMEGLVVYSGSLFLTAGYANGFTSDQTWVSTNGTNWSMLLHGSFPARQGHACVTNDNKIWIMAGNGAGSSANELNDVWMFYY